MKGTITWALVRNAIESAKRAGAARAKSNVDEEVECCVAVQVMMGMALEGITNEVGHALCSRWLWDRIEKRADVAFKWWFLSGFGKGKQFDPGEKPLQTIEQFRRLRNRIAHPKVEDLGDEIIIRTAQGNLKRYVGLDEPLHDGDQVHVGLGKLLNEFNACDTVEKLAQAMEAVEALRDHLQVKGLEWLSRCMKDLQDLREQAC